jgi:OmpA-OmpF porin, OOP family
LPKLDAIVAVMKQNPGISFNVEGYTDSQGLAQNNRLLSQKRADAVKKYMVEKGVADARLNAIGYGSETPIADNKTAAGRAKNRRVEVKPVQ